MSKIRKIYVAEEVLVKELRARCRFCNKWETIDDPDVVSFFERETLCFDDYTCEDCHNMDMDGYRDPTPI